MDHNEINFKTCVEKVDMLEREVCILRDYLAARTADMEQAKLKLLGLQAELSRMIHDREYCA